MYFNTVVSLEGGRGWLHSRDPKQLIKEPSLALGLSFKTNKGVAHTAGWEAENFCFQKQWAAPLPDCTHSSAEHSGLKPFTSPSAKRSHLGRPFRLQLSERSTDHSSFGGCFYPKCPMDTQVFTFLATLPQEKEEPVTLAVAVPC